MHLLFFAFGSSRPFAASELMGDTVPLVDRGSVAQRLCVKLPSSVYQMLKAVESSVHIKIIA